MTALIILVVVFAAFSLILAVTSVTGVLPGLAERRRTSRQMAAVGAGTGSGPAAPGGDGERLRHAEQLRNSLLARMSHEIRTPLNSVITLSELLLDGNAGGLGFEQRKYVEIIHRNGQKLLSLINDVLDLSSLEAGRVDIELGNVELGALVQSVVGAATAHAQSKGLALRFNASPRPAFARADRERLRQVLANVVDSSIGMTANGYVEVTVEPGAQEVHIRISDTGAGIAEELRDHLQEVKLQEPAALGATELESGPRLGLAVASRLVTLMGGSIKVESQAGEGTTFDIAMPAGIEERIGEPTPRREPTATERISGRVLVIEDDDFERRHVVEILESVGYDATPAASGEEGLNLLRDGRYDAVVLDLVMPGMSGLDVLRAARAEERLVPLPFVVLSALYMTRSEREVLGPNAVAVVRKGDAIKDELVASLRKAIKAPPETRRPTPPPAATAPARVLLVVENADNLYAIQQVLAVLPVSVDTAHNLPEATELLHRVAPDIVLLDVSPEHAAEVTRAVRERPDSRPVPVIDLAQSTREPSVADENGEEAHRAIQPLDVVTAVSRVLHLAPH